MSSLKELEGKSPKLYKGFMENQFWKDLADNPTHGAKALIVMELFDFVTAGDQIELVFVDLNSEKAEANRYLKLGEMTVTVIGKNCIYQAKDVDTSVGTLSIHIKTIKRPNVVAFLIHSRSTGGVVCQRESPFDLGDYYCELICSDPQSSLTFGKPRNCGYSSDQYDSLIGELVSIAKRDMSNAQSGGMVY